jgi:hypothetical protein
MMRPVLLIPFLVFGLAAQDLPDGEGRRIVQNLCSSCHDIGIVTAVNATEAGWRSIVNRMLELGATASEDEVEEIVEYLAKAFPRKDVRAAEPAKK